MSTSKYLFIIILFKFVQTDLIHGIDLAEINMNNDCKYSLTSKIVEYKQINQYCNNRQMSYLNSNPLQTPINTVYRVRQNPQDTIIRQVITPSAYQQGERVVSNYQKINVVNNQPQASINKHSYRVIQNQAQFVNGVNLKGKSRVNISTVPPQLPVLAPTRRIQYVPYEQKYIEYVQQRVKVPVQRVCTDYYQIEHIIDYVPIQKQEIVYEMQPQEVVTMKLQYVPVEQKIIHISDRNAKVLGINNYVSTDAENPIQENPLYQQIQVAVQTLAVNNNNNNNMGTSSFRRSKTNFVTSDGYDPQKHLQHIDNILSSSRLRDSKAKLQS